MATSRRIATGVDWVFALEWLTIQQACALTNRSALEMLDIIEADGVDLKDDAESILIEERSLREYQEACVFGPRLELTSRNRESPGKRRGLLSMLRLANGKLRLGDRDYCCHQ